MKLLFCGEVFRSLGVILIPVFFVLMKQRALRQGRLRPDTIDE